MPSSVSSFDLPKTTYSSYPLDGGRQQKLDWVAALPLLNFHRSAQMILEALRAIDSTPLSCQDALDNLEILNPVTNRLSSALYDYYCQNASTEQLNKREEVCFSEAIHQLFAENYAAIAIDKTNEDEASKALCLHRGLHHCGVNMLRCYQLYQQTSGSVWQLSYALYAHADEQHLLDRKVCEQVDGIQWYTSINDQFLQIVLLGVASSYQLSPSQVNFIYHELLNWVDEVRIEQPVDHKHLFVFDIESEQAPLYQSFYDGQYHGQLYGMDFSLLIERIQKEKAEIEQQTANSHSMFIAQSTLEHLLRVWSAVPGRRYERIKSSGPIKVCVGLSSVHYFMRQFFKEHDEVIQPPKDTQLTAWNDPFFNDKLSVDLDKHQDTPIKERQDFYSLYTWQLINSSEDGFCLCTEIAYCHNLKPGQIIGLELSKTEEHNEWYIGHVCWIRFDNDKVFVGIQLIADQFNSVWVQNEQQRQHHQMLRALRLNSDVEDVQLLLPSTPYDVGDMVFLKRQQDHEQYLLSELMDSNDYYKVFRAQIS